MKGKEFENYIMRWFETINRYTKSLAIRLDVPVIQSKNGLVRVRKQPFDFMILTKNSSLFFDAKQTVSNKLYFSKIPSHQIQEILKLQEHEERESGFLVWFKKEDPTLQNLRFIYDIREWDQNGFVTVGSGKKFDFKIFLELIS